MEFLISLFGQTGAKWAQIGIALLFVLALILLAFWVFRALKGVGMGIGGLRGRLPRLAVLDYADVDSRRRLVLIRRDNVEHLLLLGGPTDVVVETNILRVPQAVSSGPVGREPEMPAAVDPAANETSNRLSPRELARLAAGEPALRTAEDAPRPVETPARQMVSPRTEPLAAADPAAARPLAPPRSTPPFLSAGRPRPEAEPVAPSRIPPPPRPAAPAPSVSPDVAMPVASAPGIDLPPPPKPAYVPPPRPERPAASAGSFSERLDAALKKPISPFGERKPADLATTPAGDSQPLPMPPVVPSPPPSQAPALSASEKSVFDSLEEEMASLLGRGPKGS